MIEIHMSLYHNLSMCYSEVAFWLVRPDDHTIWAVHVCVAIRVVR
jgi:hypothetical protein